MLTLHYTATTREHELVDGTVEGETWADCVRALRADGLALHHGRLETPGARAIRPRRAPKKATKRPAGTRKKAARGGRSAKPEETPNGDDA